MGVKRALEAKPALPLERVASLLWFAAFSVCGSRFLLGEKRGFHQGGVVNRLFGADQSHWAEGRWANVNIKAGTKDYRPLASGGSREKKKRVPLRGVWIPFGERPLTFERYREY